MCPCCYCDVEESDAMIIADCGHGLCTECFEGYCKAQIASGPDCVLATCPDQECQMILPTIIFQKSVETLELVRYKTYLQDSIVEVSNYTKWCPGRNCKMICETKFAHPIDVTCTCGESFCYGCLKGAHKPCDEAILQMWIDRTDKGSEDDSANWLKLNTK